MKLQGIHLIGKRTSKKSKQLFNAINPQNNEILSPEYANATYLEINQAIGLADTAFTTYKNKTPEERAVFLETIGDEIMNLGDELIEVCNEETALPAQRLQGERSRTVNQLKMFARVVRQGNWLDARIDTPLRERKPMPKPDLRQIHIPLGAVAVFGASNFPLAFSVAGGDTASALAAGCPVVYKANPAHPRTSEMVGAAVIKAAEICKMPDGVFSLLHGISHQVGLEIVKHPKIKAVGFTGSFKAGNAIFKTANKRRIPIPVYAEMGSSNPVFILPGAINQKHKSIAKGLTQSVNMGVGQFCTKPGLIFIAKSENTGTFIKELTNEFNATLSHTMLTEEHKRNYYEKIATFDKFKTVKILTKHTKKNEKSSRAAAHLLHITGETYLKKAGFEEEIFGPAALIVELQNNTQIFDVAGRLNGQLTATVHGTTDDMQHYEKLLGIIQQKAGRIILNGYPTGVEVCDSMHHGGPYPATTDLRYTSVGTAAIRRFARPVCFQDYPQELLPEALRDKNTLKIWRTVNAELTKDSIGNPLNNK